MKTRLEALQKLLSRDGSIWISIDDDECHYLKFLCDEVFGRKNFVSNVIWEKKYSPQNDARWLSDSHDHILVYAKNKDLWRPNLLPRTELMNAQYKNPDNDPRGSWMSDNPSVKTYSAATDYPITTPSGRVVNPPTSRSWRFSKEKFVVENKKIIEAKPTPIFVALFCANMVRLRPIVLRNPSFALTDRLNSIIKAFQNPVWAEQARERLKQIKILKSV